MQSQTFKPIAKEDAKIKQGVLRAMTTDDMLRLNS